MCLPVRAPGPPVAVSCSAAVETFIILRPGDSSSLRMRFAIFGDDAVLDCARVIFHPKPFVVDAVAVNDEIEDGSIFLVQPVPLGVSSSDSSSGRLLAPAITDNALNKSTYTGISAPCI